MAKMTEYKRYSNLEFEVKNGIARVTLNRPDIRNAFNDEVIIEFCNLFQAIKDDDTIRVVVLTGAGTAFCAGADLNWMQKVADYDIDENVMDSQHMVDMLEFIDRCPKPVIGRINGAAVGGGCGLVAVCDIAIASRDAMFAFSEVKLGIIPAAISPYVIRKIGIGPTRELFLTGERFDANRAKEIGLVNAVAAPEALDAAVDSKVKLLLTSGPKAMGEVKRLVRKVPYIDPKDLKNYTAELIANLRVSDEGHEGISAFLQKRDAKWVIKDKEKK
jgi:methylglutaconyl-CoA hydratase